jgi:hypothetical protein
MLRSLVTRSPLARPELSLSKPLRSVWHCRPPRMPERRFAAGWQLLRRTAAPHERHPKQVSFSQPLGAEQAVRRESKCKAPGVVVATPASSSDASTNGNS